ncbi:ABC transporter substrate-binding protein [Halobacteriales archaeon SW_8_65_20]|nr:MAG: ABC transporter substrate-binding protein [Halobacteriales archaeon SW_8_65_20]
MARDELQPQDGSPDRFLSRRQWLAALGVTGTAALAGCSNGNGTGNSGTETQTTERGNLGGDTPTDTPREELPPVNGAYRPARSSEVTTLNPLYNTENTASGIIDYTMDSTYTFAPGTEVFPLALDLQSDDNEVWVATVRDGLEFSDPYGSLTAEDYVYLISEVHQPKTFSTSDSSNFGSDVNVTQNSEMEFQIELPEVSPLYPETYDPLINPAPKDLIQPYVEDEDDEGMRQDEVLNNLEYTGNLGPYTLDTWERSNRIILTRNEDYYLKDVEGIDRIFQGAPYFEQIESKVIPEQSSRLAAFEKGEIDAVGVPPEQVQKFQDLEETKVIQQPTPYNSVCTYNFRNNGWSAGPGNLFRKQKVRQGLACAVNKADLIEGVYRGYGTPEYTWQPEWSQFYPEDDSGIPKYGSGDLYGPEPTQSRIKEGISDTDYGYDGDGRLLNPSGQQCELTIYCGANSNTNQTFAQFIAREVEENAGIVVNVEPIQTAQFDTNYLKQPETDEETEWSAGAYNRGGWEQTSDNTWDLSVNYGLNTYPLNPATAETFFIKDGSINYYGYQPDWDAAGLFSDASNAETLDELKSVTKEIFENVATAQPMGMFLFGVDTPGYAADIQGPAPNFFSGWDFSAWYRGEN